MRKRKQVLSNRTRVLIDKLIDAAEVYERDSRQFQDARKALERRLFAQEQQAKRDRATMLQYVDKEGR